MKSQESAETLALQALTWLLQDQELAGIFLGATGASQDDLRHRAGDAEFLASVLDFLLMDDKWVMGFCDSQGLAYEAPMAARARLPGGEAVHWT